MSATVLYAPEGYWNLSPSEKEEICNGCGPKGLGGWIVPNTLYGLSIKEACNIHDYMYWVGKTERDREEADRAFLNNMVRIISDQSGVILRPFRRYRAMTYYGFVQDIGGPAFWDSKNPPETMKAAA